MEKISCEIKLKIGENFKSPKEIIEYVKDLKKYDIFYGDSLQYSIIEEDEKKVRYTIDTKSCIDNSIKCGGIYFIFTYENDKLLYIGKSKNLKARLKQHLIRCCLSTGSHILDLVNHLKERKIQGKMLAVKYCIINTLNNKDNSAIEGSLIDYAIENRSNIFFDECWNSRLD